MARSEELTRLRRLDLNLLTSLDCLLSERGVSKAARRLRLSQSTLSDSLARLRRHFDDPLLQGVPRAYELSPLAQRLRPLVMDAVRAADRVFAGAEAFDPESDAVEFRFVVSDHTLTFGAARLTRAITAGAVASNVRVTHFPEGADPVRLLQDADGVILPYGDIPPDVNSLDLGVDELVLVRASDTAPINAADELSYRPWVAPAAACGSAIGMRQLAASGIRARVAVELPSIASVPFFIEGTDRLALLPRSLAERLTHCTGIALQRPPVRIDPVRIALWWHANRADDAVHQWLRQVVSAAFNPSG